MVRVSTSPNKKTSAKKRESPTRVKYKVPPARQHKQVDELQQRVQELEN